MPTLTLESLSLKPDRIRRESLGILHSLQARSGVMEERPAPHARKIGFGVRGLGGNGCWRA